VIEITRPEEFQIRKESYPILRGKLNKQNHKIHNVEGLTLKKIFSNPSGWE